LVVFRKKKKPKKKKKKKNPHHQKEEKKPQETKKKKKKKNKKKRGKSAASLGGHVINPRKDKQRARGEHDGKPLHLAKGGRKVFGTGGRKGFPEGPEGRERFETPVPVRSFKERERDR